MSKYLIRFLLVSLSVMLGAYTGRVWAQSCGGQCKGTCTSDSDGVYTGKYKTHNCQMLPCGTKANPPTCSSTVSNCATETCTACKNCPASTINSCPASQTACDDTTDPMFCTFNLCGC